MAETQHPTDQDRATVLAKREGWALGRCSALHGRGTIMDDECDDERDACDKCRLVAKRVYPLTKTVSNERRGSQRTWRCVDGVVFYRYHDQASSPWHELPNASMADVAAIRAVITQSTITVNSDE